MIKINFKIKVITLIFLPINFIILWFVFLINPTLFAKTLIKAGLQMFCIWDTRWDAWYRGKASMPKEVISGEKSA